MAAGIATRRYMRMTGVLMELMNLKHHIGLAVHEGPEVDIDALAYRQTWHYIMLHIHIYS